MREWTLKRDCSLPPWRLALFYASLCLASLVVAGLFAWRGAGYVFGFALLEMAAVGLAFLTYARHAADREHIVLDDDCLLVELIVTERVRQFRLNRHLTRVEMLPARRALVRLAAAGQHIEVGRFLTESKRRAFAQELEQELRRDLAAGG